MPGKNPSAKQTRIARTARVNPREAAVAVDALLESLAKALVAGHRIELRGFGTFETVLRAPRTGRNPRTGAKVKIPSRRVPVFRPGKRLKGLGTEADTKGTGGKQMAAPVFVIQLGVYTFRDATFGPRLLLEIHHSDRVDTERIPAAEAFPTEQAALEHGKTLAAAFMQSTYPGQGYNLEE